MADVSLLVVDNDLAAIDLLDSVIDQSGLQLRWEFVTRGEEALHLIARRSQAYGLVWSEFCLDNGYTGADLWLEARDRFGDMPFVFASAVNPGLALYTLGRPPDFIAKPLKVSCCRELLMKYFSP